MEAGRRRGSTAFNITSIIGTNDNREGEENETKRATNQREDISAVFKSHAKSSDTINHLDAISVHKTISLHDTIRQNQPFFSQQALSFADSHFDSERRFLHEFQARERGHCHEISSVREKIVPFSIAMRRKPELLKSLHYEDAPDMCYKFSGYLNQRINPYCPYYPGKVLSFFSYLAYLYPVVVPGEG